MSTRVEASIKVEISVEDRSDDGTVVSVQSLTAVIDLMLPVGTIAQDRDGGLWIKADSEIWAKMHERLSQGPYR